MRRRGCDLPDHDFRRWTGDARQIVVLGEPVARVAEAIRQPRQVHELRKAADPGVAVVRATDRERKAGSLSAPGNLNFFSSRNVGVTGPPVNPDVYGLRALTKGPPMPGFTLLAASLAG